MPPDPDPFPVDQVAARLDEIRSRITVAGGDPSRVTVCAVTKGLDVAAVEAARAVGLVDVGENYAQELVAKQDQMVGPETGSPVDGAPGGIMSGGTVSGGASPGGLRWHMIGRLQRNKVRLLAGRVACWQSVDRLELGREIARHDPGARVLVQVNATDEADKGGFAPSDVEAAVRTFTELGLDVGGLMAVGPTDPAADPRPAFRATSRLAEGLGLAELSMGMSGDLEAAVAAGSTMVRVGTALFGPRPPHVTSRTGFGG